MSFTKVGFLAVKILLLLEIFAVLSAKNSSPYRSLTAKPDLESFYSKGKDVNSESGHLMTGSNILLKQKQFVPLKGFGPVFEKSLLVFRGETVHFDFNEIQTLGVPYLHINSDPADNSKELASYDRINSLNISLTLRWFVRHQVTVFGEMEKPWFAMHPGVPEYKLQQRTVIPVHPQTLIVMDTWINRGDTFKWPRYSIPDVFERTARSITSLFNYDVEAGRPLDAFVFCSICRFERYMLPRKDRPRQDVPTLRFEWDLVNVATQLNENRAKITGRGRHCLWSLKNTMDVVPGLSSRIALDEFSSHVPDGSLDGKPWIMKIEKFKIAVAKVLFPVANETSTEHCLVHSDCEPSPAYCRGVKPHEFRACFNRGLAGVPDPDIPLTLAFTNNKEDDASVVFITSERVQVRNEGSAWESLNVVEPPVWILMILAIITTSLLLTAMLQRHSRDRSSLSRKQHGRCKIPATVAYFFLAFLGQYPRNLPFELSSVGNRKGVFRFCLVPCILGLTLVTNWYTAFLSSSFNFTFPYELGINDYQAFENFSLYLIFDKATLGWREKQSIHLGQIQGEWFSPDKRQFIASESENINNVLKPLNLPGGKLSAMYGNGFNLRGDHPTLTWLFNQAVQLGLRSQYHLPCSKEQNTWAKMIYRMDAIDQSELSMHVGFHYKNLTRQGRKLGLELIRELGNKTFKGDAANRVAKKPFVMPNDGKPDGNTFYWMTRRSEAVFLVAKTEFPWYWNKFKKLMRDDQSLKFAHTGPQELKYVKIGQGLGGNGFESPISISGPWDKYLPEFQWMMQRIRALTHSGILGFFAKWDRIVRPPTKEPQNEFIEESDTGYQALTMQHDLVKAAFTIFLVAIHVAVLGFMAEITFSACVYVP